MGRDEMSGTEQLARGIAAMGRVARDEDGFTVYSTAAVPDAFRVWEDPHAGRRCSCERFGRAFAQGEDVECEHIRAVALWLDAPADEVDPTAANQPADGTLRRVV